MAPQIKKYDRLVNEGPLPATEFDSPELTTNQRRHGISKFRLNNNVAFAANGQTRILYLLDDHNAEEIIRAYLDANPEVLDQNSLNQISHAIRNHGRDYSHAWADIRDEYGLGIAAETSASQVQST
jgi:predicted glycosyltransferase involved in capsule biosynthesis